ncbi:hypothetical protein N1031_06865 [Herbiconiux moechotypicola]|uniref:Lipoprotein n=1 Tax=Herbiconiux moechotypicola TaxID=637393 RepID=A0ABP5QAF7_9MICO|nr:hypothetical protein [Herbiconiux moechotypicola]MCS5729478.1 hypothetical protein [Herbiconiux moechotypicola]
MKKRIAALGLLGALGAGLLAGCTSDADRASENLSTAAEQFEVQRQITFINGITDREMVVVEGRCSVETADSFLAGAVEVTCKVGEDQYKKNFLVPGDNAIVTVEQLDPIDVSVYHYRFIIKPENLLPDLDVQTGDQ